ncbi:MAG: Fe2+-dicitrate sensor membrane [Bacteroidetes bacterium]|nr:MAG: Fe2+-dicitrate sensor membrane [Bacteroidota bacterium]
MKDFDETLLIKKIEGSTTPLEEELISTWLLESEENLKTYTRIKALWYAGKVSGYAENDVVAASVRKINSRIDKVQSGQKRIKAFRLLKYAAVIALLIGLGGVILEIAGNIKPEMISVENGINQGVKLVELPDGTKAWLNLGATLSYPVKFSKNERVVEIQGEVFLEVAKIPDQKFMAETPAFTIEVTGTSFNVNTSASGRVEVVLVEGSVNLLDKNGDKAGNLIPGQMASANPGESNILISKVNTRHYTAWQEGLVIMEKAEIADIIKKIEEVYGVEIIWDTTGNHKNTSRYNFVFRKSQSFDTVFEMLRFVAPLKDMQIKRKAIEKK